MTSAAACATLQDTRRLIEKTVLNFKNHYGGDEDELRSEAYGAFLKAFATYDPQRGTSFSTWLYTLVDNALRGRRRRNAEQAELLRRYRAHAAHKARGRRADFSLRRLLLDVSADAAEVLRLVVSPDAEMRHAADAAGADERRPGALRDVLIEHLLDSGWSVERVRNCFAEVREALAG